MPTVKFHPYANLFPLLEGAAMDALVEDISVKGLREPIWLHEDGSILDGRNRWLACAVLGLEPATRVYNGDDPLGFVISLNLKRRHLNESQRAMVADQLADLKVGRPAENAQICAITQERAAALLSVSRRTVQDARRVREHAIPEVIAAVNKGEMAVSLAASIADKPTKYQTSVMEKVAAGQHPIPAIRAVQLEERRDIPPPKGLYDVIVIDPPWPMQKINREIDKHTDFVLDYPTMSLEEIAALKLPAADHCHLFCWTTQKFLFETAKIIEGWGFRYIQTFVWRKPGGFQLYGLAQSNCEFVLYCRKGSPIFTTTKDFFCCFEAPRGQHSEKPEAFYAKIRRVTQGSRRLDMFSRQERDGFTGWGNEHGKLPCKVTG